MGSFNQVKYHSCQSKCNRVNLRPVLPATNLWNPIGADNNIQNESLAASQGLFSNTLTFKTGHV